MNSKFKPGQQVLYEGKITFIETINKDNTCVIANPNWDWDSEAECVYNDMEYEIPYWIKVKTKELKGNISK
jgi:hypothetical protein